MATFRNASFGAMVEGTMKRAAAALRDAEVPFCLFGSLAAWARGGPESSHDLDFGIREEDMLRAAEALDAAGMRIEVPPEEWLIKAWDGGDDGDEPTLVDLIYAPSGMRIDDELLGRAEEMDVLAVRMPVVDPTDLLTMKLLALREQHLDYSSCVSTARGIREQLDWPLLRSRTAGSPYAAAFFTICDGLGIPTDAPPADRDVITRMQAFGQSLPRHPELRRQVLERFPPDGS